MKVPHTGSFLSSPPVGVEAGREDPGGPDEALNNSPKALVIIAITDLRKVRIRRPMTRYRIPRNIYLDAAVSQPELLLLLGRSARLGEVGIHFGAELLQHRL